MTRLRVVMLASALVLVSLLVWGLWWWTHPTLLTDRSELGNAVFPPTPLARATAQIAVAVPDEGADETIEFTSASARFTKNTARATAAFSVCVPRKPRERLAAITGDLGEYCSKVRPIRNGTKLHWVDAPYAPYVVMTVTPTRVGNATVDQVTFAYARSGKHLGQHGTSRSVVRFVVQAR